MNAKECSTLTMTRQEWLNMRKCGIGGSDAAAIMGMNPYKTPFAVWAEKTGQLPEAETNERMRLGNALEPYVANRFTEITGKKVRRNNVMLFSPEFPFALANIDRAVVGEKAGLEIKTTSSMNLKRFQSGDFPEEYYVQCVHYLAVTGWERWYLCVLVLGSPEEPRIFTIERDEEEIKALMEAEQDFWERNVLAGVAPPVDGVEATTHALNVMYTGGDESVLCIDEANAIESYLALSAQIEEMQTQKERLAQHIKRAMGDHEQASCGLYQVHWPCRTRSTFDQRAFTRANPTQNLLPFFKTTTYRDFRVKGGKPV